MCKQNEKIFTAIGAELDPCRRVGRPDGSRQAIPALPDPVTGLWPDARGRGNARLKPPVVH